MNFKKSLYFLICYSLVISILIGLPIKTTAATSEVQEIDIVTTPEKVLFEITNFKPGDWSTRTLNIKNSGKQDFNYLASAKLTSGSKELYQELLLTISSKSDELYKGKLGDFKKLDPRFISSNGTEDLIFTVEFPSQLGNEFQGLKCEVEFKFYVEGTLGGLLPVDGPKLPNTATDTFNYLAGGIALIFGGLTFYLINNRIKLSRKHKLG